MVNTLNFMSSKSGCQHCYCNHVWMLVLAISPKLRICYPCGITASAVATSMTEIPSTKTVLASINVITTPLGFILI